MDENQISSPSNGDDAAHIAAIEVDPEPGEAPPEGVEGVIDGRFVSRDAWHDGMVKGLMLAHHMTGLQSLGKGAADPAARDATGAMYDICIDTPALHFLVQPGSIWLQRAMAIGAWTIPMAMGCAAEIAQRKRGGAPPANDSSPRPANDNASHDGTLHG